MIPKGKTKILGGKPDGYDSTHHKSKIGLVLNPGVRNKRPVNNHPDICKALKFFSKRKVLETRAIQF